MFKFVLLSLLTIVTSFHAEAALALIQYEDYVHLNERQKEEYHIKVMELVVEIESAYKHETETYGFNQNRFEKYQKIMTSISSALLFPSAIAADPVKPRQKPPVSGRKTVSPAKVAATGLKKNSTIDWDAMAEQFAKLSTRDKENGLGNCLFAGWVSRSEKGPDGKIHCKHPDFIMGTQPNRLPSPESVNYPVPKSGSGCENFKDSREWVQCNPVIFGYKKVSDQSLFCVRTNNKAESAALSCMQKALTDSAPGADSRPDRMKDLKERYSNNKSAFESVFMFNYKTCVCSVPQANFNQSYQDYMRPREGAESPNDRYRTCFGMMKMMNEAVNECDLPVQNNAIFQSFSEFLNSNKNSSGTGADSAYRSFLKTKLTANRNSIIAYNELCEANLAVPEEPTVEVTPQDQAPAETKKKEYVCTATCAPNAQASEGPTPAIPSQFTCSYVIKEDGAKEFTGSPEPDQMPANNEVKSIKVKHKDVPEELQCEISWPEKKEGPTKELTPSINVEVTNEGDKEYTIKATTLNDEGWTISWSRKGDTEKVTPKKNEGSTLPASTGTEEVPKEGTGEKPESAASSAEEDKGSKEVKRERKKKTYEVCAVLKKEGKPDVTGNCVSVAKAGEKPKAAVPPVTTPMNYGAGGPQMPQPVIRGSSDTSAAGIR